jgi:hypothetical protein
LPSLRAGTKGREPRSGQSRECDLNDNNKGDAVTTLADQFHDTFDAYYAGKKSWTQPKPVLRPEPARQSDQQQGQGERQGTPPESRH